MLACMHFEVSNSCFKKLVPCGNVNKVATNSHNYRFEWKQRGVLYLKSSRTITTIVLNSAFEECGVSWVAGEAFVDAGFVECLQGSVALSIITGPNISCELFLGAVAVCHQDVN
mmetsp:Transcript_123089/g.237300  ORF Transcript_123089/g.237300 Transcript_123089/m.237300 type:complete len:114 (-) Transcript_123089:226-567(-)